jgi:hypothetical protein
MLAKRVIDIIRMPYDIEGNAVNIGTSIGPSRRAATATASSISR